MHPRLVHRSCVQSRIFSLQKSNLYKTDGYTMIISSARFILFVKNNPRYSFIRLYCKKSLEVNKMCKFAIFLQFVNKKRIRTRLKNVLIVYCMVKGCFDWD